MTSATGARSRVMGFNYFEGSTNLQIHRKHKNAKQLTKKAISRPRWNYLLLLQISWHLHWSVSNLLELFSLPERYFFLLK